jgi:hypothetical protein
MHLEAQALHWQWRLIFKVKKMSQSVPRDIADLFAISVTAACALSGLGRTICLQNSED